jgi:hypothetical protein
VWLGFGIFNLTKARKKEYLGCVSSAIFILLGPLPPLLAALFFGKESTKHSGTSSSKRDDLSNIWSVVQIIETERRSEPLGIETREIDNSQSEIQVTRRFTVSREYSSAYTVDYEKTTGANGDLSFSVAGLSGIKVNLEKKIAEKYSISNSQKRTYTEEITLTIPAKKRVSIRLNWKQIWQYGIIRLQSKENVSIQIPFKVNLEPTFDQQQIDMQ